MQRDVSAPGHDPYEQPSLTRYGAIEEWARGRPGQIIEISIIVDLP